MPYCRKCGVKLADDARFCYNCGTPVIPTSMQQAPPVQEPPRPRQNVPLKKNPLFIPVMIIIALTVSALIIAAVAAVPLNQVNFNEQSQIPKSGTNKLSLDFIAEVGDVNVYTNLTGDIMLLMNVSATGSTSLFASRQPVTFKVQNSTTNNSQNITAQVSGQNYPFNSNLNVVCNIYVNPEADLTLNVRSELGNVYMNAGSQAKILSLKLETSLGNTVLELQKDVIVRGDLTLSTSTGNIEFNLNQAGINGNRTVEINSGTGNINLNIVQIKKLNGNLQVNAHTGTGNIYLDRLAIDGEVAARIVSGTGIGRIYTNLVNFNGDQSPIESNNYPAVSVINIDLNTGIGNIYLNAAYETTTVPVVRN
jgi:hypothetical protein